MRFRSVTLAAVTAALVGMPSPASANTLPGSSEDTQTTTFGVLNAVCNFLFSGPSLDPSSTPFRIDGVAAYTGAQVAAATTISCRLRKNVDDSLVGAITMSTPGPASNVFGSIPVNTFGPFKICTMANVLFTDGSETNPSRLEKCRALVTVNA